MKLHVFPPSPNARKVLFVAQHLGIPHETQLVDLSKGDQRKPEYLKINPNGVMPSLEDGDFVLWESDAIMQYLCSKKPGQTLWPSDPKAQADVSRWQCWELAHWSQACGTLIFENLVKGMFGAGPPDPARVADGEARVQKYAQVLDDHLRGRKFLTGDTLTLADVSNAVYLAFIGPARLPVGSFQEVKRWAASLDQIPAWKATAPQMPGAQAAS